MDKKGSKEDHSVCVCVCVCMLYMGNLAKRGCVLRNQELNVYTNKFWLQNKDIYVACLCDTMQYIN